MLDKRAYLSFFVLIGYTLCFNVYLYELFYGPWQPVNSKGFFYLITIVSKLYLFINRKVKKRTELSEHIDDIMDLTVIINFVIIMLSLYDLIFIPLLYFFIYNGSVLVTTLIVLIIGSKYGAFKK